MLISKFKNEDIEDIVSMIESQYDISLPEQYRCFVCKYNGGYTPKTKFKVGKMSSDIRGFYGVGKAALNIDNVGLNEWIKIEFFPIACDSFGNYIAISLGKKTRGEIYFINHEEENKAVCIGENLKAFIKKCKSEKINEASRRSIAEREQALIANGRGYIITDELRQMWQKEIDKYENMIQEEVTFD